MFDTMTLTKVTGALCGSLLVYLLGAWAAESIYAVGHKGHGDEEHAQAYSIEVAEAAPAEGATEEVAVPIEELMAAADPAAGEKVFGKCKACHKIDGTDGTGPHLNGIVNKAKGASAGFGYSEALLAVASESWTPENLYAFLENPKGYMPGTKMAFAGLSKSTDRANVIAYLAANP
ncbi:MAG: c-type cytochrome [Paracoccaceae bacterium]